MAYSAAAIRTIGRDCLNKLDAEGNTRTIQEIVNGRGMTQENADLVLEWIYTQRPNLKPQEEPTEEEQEPETTTEP